MAAKALLLLACALAPVLLARSYPGRAGPLPVRPHALVLPAALVAAACLAWRRVVSEAVPEPYLVPSASPEGSARDADRVQDEVFHIPQAQRYCEGRFRDWDDKITTPPGL